VLFTLKKGTIKKTFTQIFTIAFKKNKKTSFFTVISQQKCVVCVSVMTFN